MNIPEEVTKAVADAITDAHHRFTGVTLDEGDVMHYARAALSAAAPTLMARAWDECMATIDANAWIDWAVETPPTNPYKDTP